MVFRKTLNNARLRIMPGCGQCQIADNARLQKMPDYGQCRVSGRDAGLRAMLDLWERCRIADNAGSQGEMPDCDWILLTRLDCGDKAGL